MNEQEMKNRTKKLSYRAIDLATALPNNKLGRIVSSQLLRACTSVPSNYRAACRSKSDADFIYKLSVVEEETDECMFWMEMIMDQKLQPTRLVKPLYEEADEILSMIVASIKTKRAKSSSQSKIQNPKSKI
jgi:four helix bundle protein